MSLGVRSILPYGRFKKFGLEAAEIYMVAGLPAPYQKFYREWKGMEEKSTPVHWKPKEEGWVRNPETFEIKRVQNVPIASVYPTEMHEGLWGGEGVVEGKVKKGKYRSPVPKFWVPSFYKTVVYSQILDKYMSVVATERALQLIDDFNGLDNYLLKTPAYDLKSLLALKIKRKLFFSLMDMDFRVNEEELQKELYEQYKEYLIPREDAEWYGYSVKEAQVKYAQVLQEQSKPVPMKYTMRKKYLEDLQTGNPEEIIPQDESKSWVQKLNPFSKPASAP